MAKDLKALRSLGSGFGGAGLCLSPEGPASCFHLNLTVTHVLDLIPSCFLSTPLLEGSTGSWTKMQTFSPRFWLDP